MLKIYKDNVWPSRCADIRCDITVQPNGKALLTWVDSGKPYSEPLTSGSWLVGCTYGQKFTLTPEAEEGFDPVDRPIQVQVKGNPVNVTVAFKPEAEPGPEVINPIDQAMQDGKDINESFQRNTLAMLRRLLEILDK